MKKFFYIIHFLIFYSCLHSQNIKIYGYISDSLGNEKLLNAVILTDYGISYSNDFGYYSIEIPKNKPLELSYKYLGYKEKKILVNSSSNKRIDVLLDPENEISKINVLGYKISKENYSISVKEIKLLPNLFGEHDVLKSIQMLPGVQFGVDATSDIFVRGGTPDQNLILIDDIPLRYSNHIGGFVSIFDINAINNLYLYKNNFPTKYNGSLSSILDIRFKDGNSKKIEGEVSLGLISSKLSLNGPIVKDKLTFISNFRFCNFGLVSLALNKLYPRNINFTYYFYDLNFKVNYRLSKDDKIDFTFYNGSDNTKSVFIDSTSVSIVDNKNYSNWGNLLISARWAHNYSSKLFQKLVIGATAYNFTTTSYIDIFNNDDRIYSKIQSKSKIVDIVSKLDYNYNLSKNIKYDFGLSLFKHIYKPLFFEIYEKVFQNPENKKNIDEKVSYTTDYCLYSDLKFTINKFELNFGFNLNLYENDTFFINRMLKSSIIYNLNSFNSLLLSYDNTYQNFHLLTTTHTIKPNDIWLPASKNLKSEQCHQITFSYNYSKNSFSLNTSVFAKKQNNLVYYNNLAFVDDTLNNRSLEKYLLNGGIGLIYGLELFLSKSFKKITCQFSYTLMYNNRKFIQVNNNEYFPFNYDRRHFIQNILKFQISKKVSLSTLFIYATGYPITLFTHSQNIVELQEPSIYYELNQMVDYSSYLNNNDNIVIFSKINSYRIPDYHRLDINLSYTVTKKKGNSTWSINLFNTYSHLNTINVTLFKDEDNKIKLRKFGIFPTIIPSLSYSYRFK